MYMSATEPSLAATLSFPTSRRCSRVQYSGWILRLGRARASVGARAGRHVYLIEVEGFSVTAKQRDLVGKLSSLVQRNDSECAATRSIPID